MKTIYVLTLFPEMFTGILENSIIKRAISKEIVSIKLINIRDFTLDKNKRVDSAPIGGGAGLIQKCQPIIDALKSIKSNNKKTILMSPRGKTYTQEIAHQYANMKEDLVIVCGHYEGVDERINSYMDDLVSIGDYILTGGEIPSMSIIDSVTRLLDGAIANDSIEEESFEDGLLEYPQYTEPYEFEEKKVPDILYSGNHNAIKKWRRKQSLYLTRKYRPDLFNKLVLSKEDKKLLLELDDPNMPKWEIEALEKGKKFIK